MSRFTRSEARSLLEHEDMTGSDEDALMLNDLEKEYNETCARVSRQLAELRDCEPGDTSALITELKGDIQQAAQNLHDMAFEAKQLPNRGRREAWTEKIDAYKTEQKALKAEFEKDKQVAQRTELFSGAFDRANVRLPASLPPFLLCFSLSVLELNKVGVVFFCQTGTSDEQARLMQTMQDENGNTEMLREAHVQLAQTEDVAIGVQNNLYEQRGTIQRFKANVRAFSFPRSILMFCVFGLLVANRGKHRDGPDREGRAPHGPAAGANERHVVFRHPRRPRRYRPHHLDQNQAEPQGITIYRPLFVLPCLF